MISEWLEKAENGESVWLCDVKRESKASPGCEKLILSVTSANGDRRDAEIFVQRWDNPIERRFAEEYLCACVFNMLSARGGREVIIYADTDNRELSDLLSGLRNAFQLDSSSRSGLGKCISVSERMCRALGGDRLVFGVKPIGLFTQKPCSYEEKKGLTEMLSRTVKEAEGLLPLCREGGRVRITNDGNMAAYTAAMELAHSGEHPAVNGGVFAHTMGTDLGSGWISGDGTIPEIPLELYDLLIDLGGYKKRQMDPRDLRCTRNGNSGLCGARRYMGQSAAFRLAWELKPSLLDGFIAEKDGILDIKTEPFDMRKPCLEHLMQCACAGDEAACTVFRLIGENLGRLSLEAEELLDIGTKKRYIFGRFVKAPRCFDLIREGCSRVFPELELEAANEDMACTPLMKELAARKDVTVAQFGQAVGAAYFALS